MSFLESQRYKYFKTYFDGKNFLMMIFHFYVIMKNIQDNIFSFLSGSLVTATIIIHLSGL